MKKRGGDPNFYQKQDILKKFLKQYPTTQTLFKRELKILNELCKVYSLEFFSTGLVLPFSLNSLAWFKTEEGRQAIKSAQLKKTVDFSVKKPYDVGTEKIGEDAVIEKKPTLKDFLYGKKNEGS